MLPLIYPTPNSYITYNIKSFELISRGTKTETQAIKTKATIHSICIVLSVLAHVLHTFTIIIPTPNSTIFETQNEPRASLPR